MYHSGQMELEVGSMEEVGENLSDSDVDVDDSGAAAAPSQLSSAQLLMRAPSHPTPLPTPSKPKGKLVAVPPKPKTNVHSKQTAKQPALTHSVKRPSLSNQAKQANPTQAAKQGAQASKPPNLAPQPKSNLSTPSPKQPTLMAQSTKQASLIAQATKAPIIAKQNLAKQPGVIQPKQTTVAKPPPHSPKNPSLAQSIKQTTVPPGAKQPQIVKQTSAGKLPVSVQSSQVGAQLITQVSKSMPSIVSAAPQKSPLLKQRPLQKVDTSQSQVRLLF